MTDKDRILVERIRNCATRIANTNISNRDKLLADQNLILLLILKELSLGQAL